MAFLDGLKNMFGKKEASVLGVDIGSSAIKIVQIRKKNGQAILETYGELSLGPYGNAGVGAAVILPPEKIAQALIDLMNEKEVGVTTRKCGISIPFASSLMSVIELPDVGRKQLATMIPLEARKYIPVPISEVQLDWSIIPKNEVRMEDNPVEASLGSTPVAPSLPKIDVLVVAIHNDTIARYQTIVQKSGLDAGFFEIEIFSSMRAVVEENLEPVMVLDIGASSTKLYVVERGIVKVSHTINRGSQDITRALSSSLGIPLDKAEILKRDSGLESTDKNVTDIITLTLDYVFSEANRTLLNFEKKYNKAVGKVMLVGGGAALKGLAPLAKTNFKTETIAANPFQKLSAPAFIEDVLKTTGPEFAVAVGLALRKLGEEE
jgi:type IV pilus assembly protein PilM